MKTLTYLTLIMALFSYFNTAISQNTPQTIVEDMTLPPDAALHGVPDYYSWASGAANGQNTVPAKNNNGNWFQAMTSWGQVYIPVEGSQALNTRCQIRNMSTKLLYKNGKWIEVQSGNPQGAAFREDFANNASIDAGMRDESDNEGGISVKVGVGQWAGYNFHYWPLGPRVFVDVDSVVGVFTSCEARLITDNPDLADDRHECRNILQMGADWWLNLTIGWLPDWSANSGIGNARSKWVTNEWQFFNYCSLTPSQILSNPPIPGILSLNDNDRGYIIIYPNPTSDKIAIQFPESTDLSNVFISVYNAFGELKLELRLNSQKEEIPLSNLSKGLYIIKVSIDNELITAKVLKE